MMFINALAAAVVLLSPAVIAAPQVSAKFPRIQLCSESSNVNCYEPLAEPGICMTIPIDFSRRVTSLNTYGRTCNFYLFPACSVDPGKGPLAFTGSNDNLSKGDYSKYDNAIASYKCN